MKLLLFGFFKKIEKKEILKLFVVEKDKEEDMIIDYVILVDNKILKGYVFN